MLTLTLDLADVSGNAQIDQVNLVDPPTQVVRLRRDLQVERFAFDRPDLHDLAWINVLSCPGRVSSRIVVDHPSRGLGGPIPIKFEVIRTDNVALVVDADLACGQRHPDNRRSLSQFAAKP